MLYGCFVIITIDVCVAFFVDNEWREKRIVWCLVWSELNDVVLRMKFKVCTVFVDKSWFS